MPKYEKFEDLPVWQEAARLYNKVLDLLEHPNLPLTPGFRNQLDRAALSISNNIAEGFERVTTNELTERLVIPTPFPLKLPAKLFDPLLKFTDPLKVWFPLSRAMLPESWLSAIGPAMPEALTFPA